jgi:amylosucrase
MQNSQWIDREAQRTLARLLPRIEHLFIDSSDYAVFANRLQKHFPRAFGYLHAIYGEQYDFFYHLEQILLTAAQMFIERPADLRALDERREADPLWFKRETMAGGVCYVDLFAGDLEGIRERIPYFKELGLTYLHLMPLFKVPAENSDGGYAISDYRQVNPALGTMAQLAVLAHELRANGISLVLDFVFNHTSDEHEWALRALAGEEQYQRYYYIFPDRALPDQYEQHLREIFPEQAPGSFTYHRELDGWVWTTFNRFQWDLNYSNPEVFNAMLGEMLFLANQGAEILRLDAVAFIWKRLGTPCENLPEVHWIIRAFNALAQIVAPAMLFKSEAIVHPDDVASYIDWEECPISYNPTFMALIWEALATREVKLLRHSMSKRYDLPERCAWVNYVRVHDDIGWSFADEDAAEMGIKGFDHRQFLNQFYTGRFPGSFATGVGFNFNPVTRDMRICGTCASLAGVEQGLTMDDTLYTEHALRRITMIHSVIIAAGGIPLLYLGDEIATLNDYSYEQDPARADDQRWVHRPRFDWERAALRHDTDTIVGQVFSAIRHMINVRKQTPALADERTLFLDTHNPHVLGFVRNHQVLALANFSEHSQPLRRDVLAAYWNIPDKLADLLTGESFDLSAMFTLEPYQSVWLAGD